MPAVLLLETAERDLAEIHRYLEMSDGQERADALLAGIERVVAALATMPGRGRIPPELELIGVRDFRETHFKPYRIIYSIADNRVLVRCILDGRRDMMTILQQRLLRTNG